MKKISIHQLRNVLAVLIVGVLLSTAYFTNSGLLKAPEVKAGTSQNVSGWAYSKGNGAALNDGKPGIGWISLNGNDCDNNGTIYLGTPVGCPISGTVFKDYGVNINPVSTTGTGTFSGYAYSEYGDWISFNQSDLAICPVGATVAQVNWSTGKVTGWARALNGSTTSGWDGCIKFSDDTNSFWNGNGVKITAGKFSGYAWGGDVMGWIDFSPKLNDNPLTPIPNPAQVAIPVACTDATATWGDCTSSVTCTTPPAQLTGQAGIKSGFCPDLTATSTTCSNAIVTCTAPPVPTPAQTKTHFWQF